MAAIANPLGPVLAMDIPVETLTIKHEDGLSCTAMIEGGHQQR